MKLIDLSQSLHENARGSPAYPMPVMENVPAIDKEHWQTELMTLPSHCGTHIDAPNHKLRHWKGIKDFPLESFCGKAVIADFRGIGERCIIEPDDLERTLPRNLRDRIVLIATGWGYKRDLGDVWDTGIPYMSPDSAHWLVEKNIRGVGIDHWSVGGLMDTVDSLTHTIFMSDNVWIIENMCFPDEVFELAQPFEFWSLPVNMPKLSGVLCRPVAVFRSRKKKK